MITTWSKDELRRIAEADDLHISPFREDGVTYGTPTWIWSVAVDNVLCVRAYNGLKSRWYQAAARQKAGCKAGITPMGNLTGLRTLISSLICVLQSGEMAVANRAYSAVREYEDYSYLWRSCMDDNHGCIGGILLH
jgi:hypothetical protein